MGVKISQLTEATTLNSTDNFVIERAGTSNYKVSVGTVKTTVNTNPTISGGTIDNTAIGSTTPSSGKFTSLTYTQTRTGSCTKITSSATLGNYETYLLDASNGEIVATLPSAVTNHGRIYHIVRFQTYPSAYNCIIACQSGETINGMPSIALNENYDRVQLLAFNDSGTGKWVIIGR